jgi:hypothetical protein
MINAIRNGFALFAIGAAAASSPADAFGQEARSASPTKWEYRILTREQVAELGKNDVKAGLNILGEEGWQLAAVEAAFIPEKDSKASAKSAQFYLMRPKEPIGAQREEAQKRIAMAKADLAQWEDRVAWCVRMAKKGYLTEAQVQADTARLMQAKAALDKAERELNQEPVPQKERK